MNSSIHIMLKEKLIKKYLFILKAGSKLPAFNFCKSENIKDIRGTV